MTKQDANAVLQDGGPAAVRAAFDAALSDAVIGAQMDAPDMSIIRRNAMPAPPFPRDVLGPAARWCEDEARSKNVPFDFVALGLLTATAGLIGPKRRASPWTGWTEPAILWGALVGPPSFGKSPAVDSIRDAIGIIEREQNADWKERSANYEEARKVHEARQSAWEGELTAAAKKGHAAPPMPRDEIPAPPTRRRLWAGDTTTEMLVRLLAENPSGLIAFRDELSGLFGAFDKYGGSGSDRAFWLEAYGGRAYRYDRVSLKEGGLDVPFCAVSLIGGIQPDKLQEMVLAGADDGLAARPLYSWPDVIAPKRPTSVPDQTLLVSALRRVADIRFATDSDGNLQTVVLPLETDAADEFQAWYERIQWNAKLDATGKIAGAIGKLDGVCLRLALVLEHLGWSWSQANRPAPEQIRLGSLQSAVRLIDEWARGNFARVFSEASIPDETKDVQEVAKWIRTHPAKTVNARALRRTSGFILKNVKRLDAALEALVDARWLTPIVYTGPDRRRKDFEVDQRIYRPVPEANRANQANRSDLEP